MSSPAPFRQAPVEIVPTATQLATLCFCSAISGILLARVDQVRVVMHRVLNRAGRSYLQQTAPYVGSGDFNHSQVGRVLPFTTGIIGYAWKHEQIARTRVFGSVEALERAIVEDMKRVGDTRSLEDVARSYLAIPMLGAEGQVTTILYADSMGAGLFDDLELLALLTEMCRGFCRSLDQCVASPLPRIENFSSEAGQPVLSQEDVYGEVQELVGNITLPTYTKLSTLNLDVTRY